MKIQTAGQQKYYDFMKERATRLETGRIVWVSMLGVAFISALSNIMIGVVLGAIGIFLAAANHNSRKALMKCLDGVKDREDFFWQLSAPDLLEYPLVHVMISKDYVLTDQSVPEILRIEDMEKIEVGKQQDIKKVLFLTDPQGGRHEIVSCVKGDGLQETFDEIYETLRSKLHKKDPLGKE